MKTAMHTLLPLYFAWVKPNVVRCDLRVHIALAHAV